MASSHLRWVFLALWVALIGCGSNDIAPNDIAPNDIAPNGASTDLDESAAISNDASTTTLGPVSTTTTDSSSSDPEDEVESPSDDEVATLEPIDPPTSTTSTAPSVSSTTTSTAESTTAVPTAESTSTAPPETTTTTAATSATLPLPASIPAFASTISPITDQVASRLTHSWREGCPVGLDELRYLTVTHWNFDGRAATGELIVRADFAEPMVGVFRTLYENGFPIQQMQLVDLYEGDDDRSMSANNTSAFNCREVAWKPGVWSNHALGTAIDINPLVNPYVSNTRVLPPEGSIYIDRTVETLGGIYAGDVVTEAFSSIGWGWGGTWSSAKDWQHFSASGG